MATSEQDVNRAVSLAKKALQQWASFPIEKRILYLRTFQEKLQTAKNMLAETISKETGKPLWESAGEVQAMIAKVDISIDAQEERCPERTHAGIITRYKPLGVVAVLGPFNFPGHLPNGHIVPALLAGNTLVFKPSEHTPLTAEEMAGYWNHLPPSVLHLVQGGPETGKCLSQHPDIDALFFTGSWQTGKKLAQYFGSHPEKLLALEMGGNNPLMVWDAADITAAAYLTIQSAYLTSGQRCTCARRLILPNNQVGDAFLDVLVGMIGTLRVGFYTETPEPFMGPVITQEAANRLLAAQKNLIDAGAVPLVEMKKTKPNTALLSPGLLDVTAIPLRSDEEYFGPLLQVIRVPDVDAAIREANNTAFGLCAAILTDNADIYKTFYQCVRAGVVNWNAPTTGASSVAPFGGLGRSGNHRPSAYFAVDYCNDPVVSCEVPTLKIPEKQLPGIVI